MLKDKGVNPKTSESEDEYIDIQKLVGAFFQFLKRIGQGIGYSFVVIKRRILLVTLAVLIGAALGFLAYYFTKPYYTSSMTLVLAEIRNEFVENQLNNLSDMIEEDNYESIANGLDIPLASARQIKNMKFFNLDANRIDEDSILTGSPFSVELTIYDPKLFDLMEPAIVTYLESNRYFSKQKRIRQRQVESMIGKLQDEITSIDSIKTSVGRPQGPVNGFVYGQALDPTNLYRESIGMYEKQVELEADLERLDNIEVVNGFPPRAKPTGPKLLIYLLIGSALFFIIGLIYAHNLESKRNRLA
ncbi:chain length determinant protein [Pontibacter sp. BAB1700]|uniref:chain length determinant protein n=1 Tax=Pontibacter sp. BAB1700 TaxID=1144253 RepID=UPI00026BE466|nr:chain length determinant protein [Pontibacter sp. BAB1700]EJF08316.1 chain length determinant protein [Pontibacter sp. BAB1700]